jgi:hypothetical protein
MTLMMPFMRFAVREDIHMVREDTDLTIVDLL